MSLDDATAERLLGELCELNAVQREQRVRDAGPAREVLLALAEHAERLAVDEVGRALELTEWVVSLADTLGGKTERARARRARAQTLSYAGRFSEALSLFEQAETLARDGGDTIEAARAAMSSIHPLASTGRYDDAISAADSARTTFLTAGEKTLAARCDMNLGATHQRRGDPAAAIETFDRARPLVQSDPIILAKLLSNRGHALIDLDRFIDAEQSYRDALAIFVERDVHWAAAIVEGNMAELATRQGRLRRAMYHFERARRRLEHDEAPGEVARILAEQADAQEIVGLFDDARVGFEQALPTLEAHDLVVEAARARAGLGRVLLRLGRLEEADDPLQRAAAAFDILGQSVDKARIDLIRAELAARLGNTGLADSLASAALETLADRPIEAARAHFRQAQTARQCGRIEKALAAVETAVNLAERFDVAPLLADLYHQRGTLRIRNGDRHGSIDDLREAVKAVERVRGTLQSERFRAAFLGDRLAIYQDLLAALIDTDDSSHIAEIFQTVEQAKSRSLLDLVTGALDADPDDQPSRTRELADDLGLVRAELNVFYSRLADASLGQVSTFAPAQIRDEIRSRERRLESLESRISSSAGMAGLFARPAELDDVGRALPAGTALIEYFAAEGALHALVVRDRQTRLFQNLAGADDATDRVRRVHFQIRRGLRPGPAQGPRAKRALEDCRRELRAAYADLVEPIRDVIAAAPRLRFVPHGPLHALPFAALCDGPRYLVENYEIAGAPSASLLIHQRAADRQPQPIANAPLVIGVPDAAAPQIEHEIQRIAAELGADRVLTGTDAAVASVAEAMSDAALIHIACHGHFSTENPMASGLKLSDRWLTVRDVYQLRLRAELVTLSGCETGRTVVGSGDELIGLVRAFLAAGAATVLVSLWTVNDESTADLMSDFYAAWRRDKAIDRSASVTAGLRDAQLGMLDSRPHPVHWAPFIVTGGV